MIETAYTTTVENDCISIFIPMQIKRRGGNVATIIQPKNKALSVDEKPNYDYRLINALAKAHRLQQKLKNNSSLTVASLAAKEALTKSYLSRVLKLNLLAPDIIGTILAGKQPRDLRVIDFLRKDILHVWEEQKEKFGFSSLITSMSLSSRRL